MWKTVERPLTLLCSIYWRNLEFTGPQIQRLHEIKFMPRRMFKPSYLVVRHGPLYLIEPSSNAPMWDKHWGITIFCTLVSNVLVAMHMAQQPSRWPWCSIQLPPRRPGLCSDTIWSNVPFTGPITCWGLTTWPKMLKSKLFGRKE